MENTPVLSLDHDQWLPFCPLTSLQGFTTRLCLHLVDTSWLASLEKHSLSYPSPEVKFAPEFVLIFSGPVPCSVAILRPIQDPGTQPLLSFLCQQHQLHVNHTNISVNSPFNMHSLNSDYIFLSKTFSAMLYPPGMSSFPVCHSAMPCFLLVRFFTVISMFFPWLPLQLGKTAHKHKTSFLMSLSPGPLVLLCFAELLAVLISIDPMLPCLAHFPCFRL